MEVKSKGHTSHTQQWSYISDTYRATKEQRREATHSNGDKGHTHKAIAMQNRIAIKETYSI